MSDHPSIPKEPVIEALAQQWSALAELGGSLDLDDWEVMTDCPGWTVRDNLSHVIGTERSLAGEAAPDIELGDRPHLKNDIGKLNEAWIESRRDVAGAAVVDELVAVTDARLGTLRAMSQQEWDADSWTPAGPATFGRFMQIRLFDCWMHEQDIRVALGQPGHLEGPCAEGALDEVERSLGFVVGKRGGAPDGSRVQIELSGPTARTIRVAVDGRARVVDAFDGEPTATLTAPFDVFMRLIGGRTDPGPYLADATVTLDGDIEVAERIATNLAYVI